MGFSFFFSFFTFFGGPVGLFVSIHTVQNPIGAGRTSELIQQLNWPLSFRGSTDSMNSMLLFSHKHSFFGLASATSCHPKHQDCLAGWWSSPKVEGNNNPPGIKPERLGDLSENRVPGNHSILLNTPQFVRLSQLSRYVNGDTFGSPSCRGNHHALVHPLRWMQIHCNPQKGRKVNSYEPSGELLFYVFGDCCTHLYTYIWADLNICCHLASYCLFGSWHTKCHGLDYKLHDTSDFKWCHARWYKVVISPEKL